MKRNYPDYGDAYQPLNGSSAVCVVRAWAISSEHAFRLTSFLLHPTPDMITVAGLLWRVPVLSEVREIAESRLRGSS